MGGPSIGDIMKISENIGRIDHQIRETNSQVGQMDHNMRETNAQLGQMNHRIHEIQARVEMMDGQVRELMNRGHSSDPALVQLSERVGELADGLGTAEKEIGRKASAKISRETQERVGKMEFEVGDLTKVSREIDIQIQDLRSRIQALSHSLTSRQPPSEGSSRLPRVDSSHEGKNSPHALGSTASPRFNRHSVITPNSGPLPQNQGEFSSTAQIVYEFIEWLGAGRLVFD